MKVEQTAILYIFSFMESGRQQSYQRYKVTEGTLSEGGLRYHHHTMFDISSMLSLLQIDKQMNFVNLFTFYLEMRAGLFINRSFGKLDSFVC